MTARVSVAIVAYRSRDYLPGCLRGLAEQTVADFEAIVIVNGHDDDSVDGLTLPDHRFRIVRLDKNVGFAAANNYAARLAGAPWLAALNPDAIPNPDWLASLFAAAERWPTAASFGSLQLCMDDPSVLDGVGDVWHAAGLSWRARTGWTATDIPPEGEIFGPCAAGALYNRATFIDVGGFDESYFCYCEDVDLAFRLRLIGKIAVQVPSAIILHAGSAISGRRSDFTQYHGHRNRIWTFLKNTPGVSLALLMPFHLLANVLLLAHSARHGTTRAVARSYVDAFRDFPRIWRERARVQSMRTASVAEVLKAMAWGIRSPLTRDLPGRPTRHLRSGKA